MADAAVNKLRATLGSELSLEPLLAADEHVMSQDTVCPHTSLSSSVELMNNRKT